MVHRLGLEEALMLLFVSITRTISSQIGPMPTGSPQGSLVGTSPIHALSSVGHRSRTSMVPEYIDATDGPYIGLLSTR